MLVEFVVESEVEEGSDSVHLEFKIRGGKESNEVGDGADLANAKSLKGASLSKVADPPLQTYV